jgi:methyl-accepting chemotaxis protein
MGLRTMLTTFTAGALAAAFIVGAVSFWGSRAAGNAATQTFVAKDVTADILPPPMYLIELRLVLSQAIEGTLSPSQAQSEFKRLRDEYQARVAYWTANPPYGLESKLLGDQHKAAESLLAASGKLLDTMAAGGDEQAVRKALQAAHAAYLAHRAGVDATVKDSVAFADTSIAHFEAQRSVSLWAQGLVLAVAAAALIGFGLWIRRSILAAVGGEPTEAAAVARSVARGHLAVKVPAGPGDHHSIMGAMHQMCEALMHLVAQVRAGSDSIASGSGQIATGNADLSSRTEQQAGTLQKAAASMDALGATVRHNADNARQASQLANDASTIAVQGGEAVAQVVDTMKSINDSSRKIADIIGVIDGIAFQTNILALNAAVEAARAGEQGRGFAVVASEVRNLAQRSAAAAREIKDLIGASVQRVEQGTVQVDRAGATMQEVVGAIRRVSTMVGEISSACAQQSQGVSQVHEAVSMIDEDTQRNAALVEESAAAAESLRQPAQKLVQVVAAFRLT